MARIILILIVAFALYAILRYALRKQRLSVRAFLSIYIATLTGIALVYLGATGRLNPLFTLLGVVMPMVPRLFSLIGSGMQALGLYRMFKSFRSGGAGNAPQVSEIRSRYLEMRLYHDTGALDGTVLEGAFKGAKLSEMELEQLLALLDECQGDADSVNLLMAYLDREHADWRAQGGPRQEPPQSSGAMTEAQALDILGLTSAATREEVVAAHRRLIQRLHPDQGGTTFLAAQINAAKDLLLDRMGES